MGKEMMFKVIILGDTAVGKSCLLLRYCDAKYQSTHVPTVGIDFKMKTLNIKDSVVKIQLWDTAGQERFQTITSTLYKGTRGIVLVYSVDSRKSFEGISRWIKQIKENTNENISIVLIANKSDLPNRVVSSADGKQLAESCNLPFFEVSAMTGENVEAAFEALANDIYQKELQNPVVPKQDFLPNQKLTVASATGTPSGGNNKKQCCG